MRYQQICVVLLLAAMLFAPYTSLLGDTVYDSDIEWKFDLPMKTYKYHGNCPVLHEYDYYTILRSEESVCIILTATGEVIFKSDMDGEALPEDTRKFIGYDYYSGDLIFAGYSTFCGWNAKTKEIIWKSHAFLPDNIASYSYAIKYKNIIICASFKNILKGFSILQEDNDGIWRPVCLKTEKVLAFEYQSSGFIDILYWIDGMIRVCQYNINAREIVADRDVISDESFYYEHYRELAHRRLSFCQIMLFDHKGEKGYIIKANGVIQGIISDIKYIGRAIIKSIKSTEIKQIYVCRGKIVSIYELSTDRVEEIRKYGLSDNICMRGMDKDYLVTEEINGSDNRFVRTVLRIERYNSKKVVVISELNGRMEGERTSGLLFGVLDAVHKCIVLEYREGVQGKEDDERVHGVVYWIDLSTVLDSDALKPEKGRE